MIFHLSVLLAVNCFQLGGFSEPDTAQPLSGSPFQVSTYTCKQVQGESFLANAMPLGRAPQGIPSIQFLAILSFEYVVFQDLCAIS